MSSFFSKLNENGELSHIVRPMVAIDIGSNAVRLAISESQGTEKNFRTIKKIRVPLRLGLDAFGPEGLGPEIQLRAVEVFLDFKDVISHIAPSRVKAVATSALREASNSKEFIKHILKTTGIKIDIIPGEEEARLVYEAVKRNLEQQGTQDLPTLVMDLGGGSLELIFANQGKMVKTKSLDMGTVRLLKILQSENADQWGHHDYGHKEKFDAELNRYQGEIEQFLQSCKFDFKRDEFQLIGTGGNFRRLGKLRKNLFAKTSIDFVKTEEIEQIYDLFDGLSPLKISKRYHLNYDRAEVIVPALEVIRKILALVSAKKLLLPNTGLIDGVFWSLLKSP